MEVHPYMATFDKEFDVLPYRYGNTLIDVLPYMEVVPNMDVSL